MPEFKLGMHDFAGPEYVEVRLSEDGKELLVFIGDVCRLRVSHMKEIRVVLGPDRKGITYCNLPADSPKQPSAPKRR